MDVNLVEADQTNKSTESFRHELMTNQTLDELNQLQLMKHLPVLVFYMVILIIGIIGNLLVLIIYKLKLKRSGARVYIISLALADLAVCLVGVPYHGLDLTMLMNYTFTNVCKVLSCLIGACTLSSVFILLVVGLDRYLKICRPLKRQIVDFGNRKACVIAAIIAIIIAIPNGFLYGQSRVVKTISEPRGVACFIDDYFLDSMLPVIYLAFNLIVFIVSVLFLIIIYGFICRQIYQHDKAECEISLKVSKTVCFCFTFDVEENIDEIDDEDDKDDMEMSNLLTPYNEVEHSIVLRENQTHESLEHKNNDQPSTPEKYVSAKHKLPGKTNEKSVVRKCITNKLSNTMIRHSKSTSKKEAKYTKKITLMMFTITVVFVISYLPFIVISIVHATDDMFWILLSDESAVFVDFLLRFYLVNNAANPIIYSFWDRKFRKEVIRLTRSLICCFSKTSGSNDKQVSSVNNASTWSTKCTEHTIT